MTVSRGGVAQGVLVLVGLFLMAAPALFGYSGLDNPADNHRTAGPVIVATAFLGMFAITRLVRWFNALPGLWLLVSVPVIGGPTVSVVISAAAGVVVLALFWVEKADQSEYGGGWDTLVKPERLPRW